MCNQVLVIIQVLFFLEVAWDVAQVIESIFLACKPWVQSLVLEKRKKKKINSPFVAFNLWTQQSSCLVGMYYCVGF
jgi:hypothetical protein